MSMDPLRPIDSQTAAGTCMRHTHSPAFMSRAQSPTPVRGATPTTRSSDPPDVLRAFERIRRGDRRALDELFDRHHGFLLSLVRRHLRADLASRLDAADIVQDVQLEAFSRLPDYLQRRPMPFGIWLRRTALERLQKIHRFHLRVARRAVMREIRLPPELHEALDRNRLQRFSSPVEVAVHHELTYRIQIELSGLSAADQEILRMRVQQGHTNAEAAAQLEIPAETAKKRYARALQRLRDRLPDMAQG